MSEHLDERLRTAARTYRRLGNQSAESMFLEAADTICKIQAENAKLRELCSELLRMAESHDQEWIHWPEMHEELRELGVEVDA